MRILLDTNILIPAEPMLPSGLHPNTKAVVTLLSAARGGGHVLYRHPASALDVSRDGDAGRRRVMSVLLQKYPVLPRWPEVPADLKSVFGPATAGTADEVDDLLLAAIHGDVADLLISEDEGLHRKAVIAGLDSRVLRLDAALYAFGALSAAGLPIPQDVTHLLCDELNMGDPIWHSFRLDYPEFDTWFARSCLSKPRDAWVVANDHGTYSAVCIVKPEARGAYGLAGLVLKICSFKVGAAGVGRGISELLLRAVLEYAFEKNYDRLYIEVLPDKRDLISFLKRFGFCDHGKRKADRDQIVLEKDLECPVEKYATTDPLTFNILYGPRRIKLDGTSAFVVPIQPAYHAMLFPAPGDQASLFTGGSTFGNAIRKAYVCRSPTRVIPSGSILLFYRSQEGQCVECVGVAERTRRSADVDEILRFVWPRTVYTEKQIGKLCAKGEILAIRFRYARRLVPALALSQLIQAGALKAAPQSVSLIPTENTAWLRGVLA